MDNAQLIAFLFQVFTLIIGIGLGWFLSSPFNKAKFWRLMGKNKKVIWIANSRGRVREFLIDQTVGDEVLKIEVKAMFGKIQEQLALFPNSSMDGDYKTVPFGLFDAKDGRQIPLSQYAHYLGKDANGNAVFRSNEELIGNLIPPSKIMNILSTNASAARLKARNETNQDNKTLIMLVKVAAGAAVVTLFIAAYIAIQTNASLNIVGQVASHAASVGNYTAT